MFTTSARKHVLKALMRDAMITRSVAERIIDMAINSYAVQETPLHDVACLVEIHDHVGMIFLFAPTGDGGARDVGTLQCYHEMLDAWSRAPLEKAYAVPDFVKVQFDRDRADTATGIESPRLAA